MNKPVTIHDIAKIVKASPATVSRVLSNSNYPVSAELTKKIQMVAKELNYSPNMLGRQLKTNKSMTIGVIIPTISNPFYAEIVLGIEEVARKNGYHVFLCNSQQSSKLETEYLQTLLEKQVKGLIVSSISNQQNVLKEYIEKGLKVISIDQTIDNHDVYQIGFDYRKGGYMATKYLLENGHDKIAYVTAPLDRPSRIGVYQGYLDAFNEMKVKPLETWIQISQNAEFESYGSAYEFTNGKMLTKDLMQLKEKPTAILACNDLTAFGVINELHSLGIEVPGEISVVGFDNIEFSEMIAPSLTTVDHPKYEMGRFACNMLLEVLNGDPVNVKEIVLQPRLVIRSSVSEPNR